MSNTVDRTGIMVENFNDARTIWRRNMGLGSLLGKLFGSGDGKPTVAEPAESVEYKGFTITSAPLQEGGQFKTAGKISKEIDGELKSAEFIRADNHADRDAAITHSNRKAQQIVDEQGEAMFARAHI